MELYCTCKYATITEVIDRVIYVTTVVLIALVIATVRDKKIKRYSTLKIYNKLILF